MKSLRCSVRVVCTRMYVYAGACVFDILVSVSVRVCMCARVCVCVCLTFLCLCVGVRLVTVCLFNVFGDRVCVRACVCVFEW